MLISLIAIKIKTDSGWFKLPTLKGSDGDSAYRIAVNNGFIGDQIDWLDSLKGETGSIGPIGPSGPRGLDGNYYQFIYKATSTSTTPTTPTSSQSEIPPTGWATSPSGISEELRYGWICSRLKYNGVWGNFSTPVLWSVYNEVSEPSEYILPKATNTTLGGIKATSKTTESTPVVIDSSGFLFTSGGSGGGIPDVPLDTVNPKIYGRYSGDQSWQEILPPEGSVGNLQQVTTNGASSDKLLTLSGGIKVGGVLQLPTEDPSLLLDENSYGLYINDSGISGETPSGGTGTSDHSLLINRDAVNSHPTSAITGLNTALQNFSENLSIVSNAVNNKLDNSHASSSSAHSDLLNNKLDNSHASDTQAHKSIFDTKAALNGDSTKDFATKNLTVNGTTTMVENINTNLRIPQAAPTNPVAEQTYLYIE